MERYVRNKELLGKKFEEIRKKKVAVFGVGGLGNYVVTQLAGLGIKKILIVDKDVVNLENLNRQFLFSEEDVGRKKIDVVRERLKRINSDIKVEGLFLDVRDLDPSKLEGYDILFDCLDNWESREFLFKIGEELGIPIIHGAVGEWIGQVGFLRKPSKFIRKFKTKRHAIISPFVGIIASLQTLLAVKYFLGELKEEILIFVDLKEFKLIKVHL